MSKNVNKIPDSALSEPLEFKPVSTGNQEINLVKKLMALDLEHIQEYHRERVCEMLHQFTSIWDGNFGTMVVTEHFIDLLPSIRPTSEHPYRARLKAREKETS